MLRKLPLVGALVALALLGCTTQPSATKPTTTATATAGATSADPSQAEATDTATAEPSATSQDPTESADPSASTEPSTDGTADPTDQATDGSGTESGEGEGSEPDGDETLGTDDPGPADSGATPTGAPGQQTTQAPTTSPTKASPTKAAPTAKPSSYRPPNADFPLLPTGAKAGKGGAYLDFSSQSAKQRTLYNSLQSMKFPANSCDLKSLPDDARQNQKLAQKFVDCLHAAWTPWLKANGEMFPSPRLINCELSKHPECRTTDFTNAMALENEIVYSSVFHLLYSDRLGVTLAHEYAHILQAHIGAKNGGEGIIYAGWNDPSGNDPLGRRIETQSDCWAVGMWLAGHPSQRANWTQFVVPGDEAHWDAKRHRFWMKQATKGTVGACNVMVAGPELVKFEG